MSKKTTYQSRVEEAIFPSLVKQAEELKEAYAAYAKINYNIRTYNHDRRFFVTVECQMQIKNIMDKVIKDHYPSARETSCKSTSKGFKVVYSAMI